MGVTQKVILILFLPIIWLIFFIYQPKISPMGLTPETYCERVSPSSISSKTNESLSRDNNQCQKSLMIDMRKKMSLYIFCILLFFILYLSVQFLPIIKQIKYIMNLFHIYGEDLRKIFLFFALVGTVFVFFWYNPRVSPRFLVGSEYCSQIALKSTLPNQSSAAELFDSIKNYDLNYTSCLNKLPINFEMKYEVYFLLLASILAIFSASSQPQVVKSDGALEA